MSEQVIDLVQYFQDLIGTREEAKNEAYKYFNDNIRALPKTESGDWDIASGEFSNSDVDAFRHAYVSGIYTQKYQELTANLLGQLNEILGDLIRQQPAEQKNMDLWNNKVGRSHGNLTNSSKDLANSLKKELTSGGLITTADQEEDSRIYEDFLIKPVRVIKESETGRNIRFLDVLSNRKMTRQQFVSKINSGEYPGYTVAMINNLETPVSKSDSNFGNNLG